MIQLFNITILIFLASSTVAVAEERITYPSDYRNWTHIKSLVLHEGHPLENPFKGIHHIYANKEGLKGIKQGKYGNGATLVFDLLEYNTANKASSEGKRKLIGVMVRDRTKYRATGGWGFEAWSDNKRLTTDKGRSCFACHTSQKNKSYVFSQWRE